MPSSRKVQGKPSRDEGIQMTDRQGNVVTDAETGQPLLRVTTDDPQTRARLQQARGPTSSSKRSDSSNLPRRVLAPRGRSHAEQLDSGARKGSAPPNTTSRQGLPAPQTINPSTARIPAGPPPRFRNLVPHQSGPQETYSMPPHPTFAGHQGLPPSYSPYGPIPLPYTQHQSTAFPPVMSPWHGPIPVAAGLNAAVPAPLGAPTSWYRPPAPPSRVGQPAGRGQGPGQSPLQAQPGQQSGKTRPGPPNLQLAPQTIRVHLTAPYGLDTSTTALQRALYEQVNNPNSVRSDRWRKSNGIEYDAMTGDFICSTVKGIPKLQQLAQVARVLVQTMPNSQYPGVYTGFSNT